MSTQEELEELVEQRKLLDEKIEQCRNEARGKAIEQALSLITTFRLTPEDLFSSMKKGKAKSKAPPKYRDPETGKTWTGKGPTPSWLKDKNRDDYLIKAQ
ncbi:H-NS family nucleoid-associated regulatory protein [Allochromatium palmeri]|uniref:H-NS histone family protein n=1 Tax=Allochromatium palmeri TaxID=231048 RepID=A0A6N8EIH1_9GAMM|nr:H-NS histone family protein [Allochromatium palmeri]MTW22297.1 H-NS histone family protein [Allochromatium palmeri]